MHGIILAGGRGRRLGALTEDKPKPMVEVDGKPIIDYQLQQMQHYGITSVTICESYAAQVIQEYIGNKRFGIDITHLPLDFELHSAGAVKTALESRNDDDFLLMHGDVFGSLNLTNLIQRHQEQQALLTVARTTMPFDYGVFDFGEAGQSLFIGKPTHVINTGIYTLRKDLKDFLIPGEEFFTPTLSQQLGQQVKYYDFKGFWRDLGKPHVVDEVTASFGAARERIDQLVLNKPLTSEGIPFYGKRKEG